MTRNIAFYEARITFGMASFMPLLLLPGYMLLGWVIWTSHRDTPPLHDIRTAFELLLALSGGLLAAHLMTIEREEGFDELRRTYPEKLWRVPLLRTMVAVMFIFTSAGVSALLLYMAYGGFALSDIMLPAIPPALYLCGLAMLVNNLSGSYWFAAGVVGAYWFGEFISMGKYTGALFLFNHSFPNGDAGLNRGLLLVGALVFFALNVTFWRWRRAVGR